MCLAQGPQRSDTGKARTHGPSVLSQALYHWATALRSQNLYTCACKYCCMKALIYFDTYRMHVSPYNVCIRSDDSSIVSALVMSVCQSVSVDGRWRTNASLSPIRGPAHELKNVPTVQGINQGFAEWKVNIPRYCPPTWAMVVHRYAFSSCDL